MATLFKQAQRVIDAFGGVPLLHKALDKLGARHRRSLSAIYRWALPKDAGGTGGLVPSSAVPSIIEAAKREGIVLPDLFSL